MRLFCLLVVLLYGAAAASSNIFQSFQECNIVTLPNITYKFNVWVLVPFEDNYKFSKNRVRPALDRALQDAKDQINNTNLISLSSILDVSMVCSVTACYVRLFIIHKSYMLACSLSSSSVGMCRVESEY